MSATADACCLSVTVAPGATVLCPGCGSELRRPRQRPSAPPSARAVVAELLAYAEALAWVDSAAYGAGGVLRGALLGTVCPDAPVWVGSGCSSTVPLGDRREPRHPHPPSAETALRLARLPEGARAVAVAVMRDGQGYGVLSETYRRGTETVTEYVYPVVWSHGRRELRGDLELRLGWRLAEAETRARWVACVVSGDRRPAEAGARVLGAKALKALVEVWGD